MFLLLSPAKKMHATPLTLPKGIDTQSPHFLSKTEQIATVMKEQSVQELKKMMGLSDSLANLNFDRFQNFQIPSSEDIGAPAASMFAGDTYVGLQAQGFTKEDWEFAKDRVGILSGLYGLLGLTDRIQPYRLEMGTKIHIQDQILVKYWKGILGRYLAQEIPTTEVIVNLASQEYFAAIDRDKLTNHSIITPLFQEYRKGEYKTISFSAKQARGTMARYVIQNRLCDCESMKNFTEDGYQYQESLSDAHTWVFTR